MMGGVVENGFLWFRMSVVMKKFSKMISVLEAGFELENDWCCE